MDCVFRVCGMDVSLVFFTFLLLAARSPVWLPSCLSVCLDGWMNVGGGREEMASYKDKESQQ